MAVTIEPPPSQLPLSTSLSFDSYSKPIPNSHVKKVMPDDVEAISNAVLDVICKYRLEKFADAHEKWLDGVPKFLEVISAFVSKQAKILMALPAFPFKSANKTYKVLGALPDKAEEESLARLNTMCIEIGRIYPPGAKLTIISDGLVYNDLLTIPDRETWAYGEALRSLASKTCEHIDFSRLKDLVQIDLPAELDEVTYVANASNFRRAVLNQFGNDEFDPAKEVAENEDTRLTWMGYKRFLQNDLQYIYTLSDSRSSRQYRRDAKYLAGEMIRRGHAFANAIKANYPEYLRLSIHHSTGEHKISISLLPTTTSYTTPWHCTVGFKHDGTLVSAPKGDFEADSSWEIVYVAGRPSYFKQKDEISLIWDMVAGKTGVGMVNGTNGTAGLK